MLRSVVLVFGSIVCLPSMAFASDSWPQILKDATGVGIEPIYTFDVNMKTKEYEANFKVDPSAKEGERIEIIGGTLKDLPRPARRAIKEIDKDMDGDIWCGNMNDIVPDKVETLKEDAQSITFGFKPLPEPDEPEDAKLMKHMRATLTVSKGENPQVKEMHMFNEAPFKPVMVAKIDTFNMRISCEVGPDGRSYAAKSTFAITGSAMMQKLEERNSRVISNLKRISD